MESKVAQRHYKYWLKNEVQGECVALKYLTMACEKPFKINKKS